MKKFFSAIALLAYLAGGAPAWAAAIDSNHKLVVQANNTGTPTTFLDTSSNAATITRTGATQLPYKLNNTAGFFNGSEQILVPDHADWDIGTGDFTIEAFIMPTDVSTEYGWVGLDSSTNGVDFFMTSSTNIRVWVAGASRDFTVSAMSAYTWYHVAVVRQSGTLNVYLNGTAATGSGSSAGSISSATTLKIGSRADGSSKFKGWMKELRISNTARYTSGFTPTTTQFSSDSNTKLLLHFDNSAHSILEPAIKFDGSGDTLSAADHADWDFSTGSFTLEADVKFIGTQVGYIMSWNTENTYVLYHSATGYIYFAIEGSTVVSAPFAPVTGRWYHIAAVRNGSACAVYVDGVEIATGTNSSNVSNTQALSIGSYEGSTSFINAYMKNVRVSNTARYTAAFAPSQSTYTSDSNTKLLLAATENSGATTFIDTGNTGHTVTTSGDAVIAYEENSKNTIFKDDGNTTHKPYGLIAGKQKVDFIVPFGAGVAYVDGTDDYLTLADAAWQDFGTGNFTIEGWVKFASIGAGHSLLVVGQNTNGAHAAIYDTGGVAGFHSYLVGTEYYSSHGYTPVVNTWYHFRLVRSGNSLYHFINGTRNGDVEDVTGKNVTGLTEGITIATSYANNTDLNGFLDNVTISDISRGTSAFNPESSDFTSGRKRAALVI